ncbi:MAG TPA: phosphoadenylyl-sulfate reductase [Bacteroidales bacterium]|nr:MAG: phosphoadenosine phosphosulfate reductase [Bacteroidetes bacterium GWE2_42_24]OFY31615.1 MAG: phosphoadenosine phosphosulfate reductase [Bacteroidetes bacterium GWF2_43_11]PKP24796.1 MAG: phosphoadenylyl-sulfate reductase [Bacteroidetes bacterium HGW-Bacteroidetes-22]HAQ64422.1 phosphoadenylyl-sulfate reductase [Bacteroidales bacterium]HBZ67128.1 phosphoadenylyl-sulfate reductase [Bacteroidales bacterium]
MSDPNNIQALNESISSFDALHLLEWAAKRFPDKVTFATSFGAEDQVITHLIAVNQLPVKIFTLDTGRLFPETYDLIEKTQARYRIRLNICFPEAQEVEEMTSTMGINLFYHSIENRKQCCAIRKTHPLRKALEGNEMWITGLRREQAVTRTGLHKVEMDSLNGLLKLNPLIDWSEEQVWGFIREHSVAYNTLHDKGFPSIGCQPCTRAVSPGEDVRAGRWWWENPEQKECGLHK